MSQKLTHWFPPNIVPVRKGVYEQKPQIWCERFCYWDGRHWWFPSPTLEGATVKDNKGRSRPVAWRGVKP